MEEIKLKKVQQKQDLLKEDARILKYFNNNKNDKTDRNLIKPVFRHASNDSPDKQVKNIYSNLAQYQNNYYSDRLNRSPEKDPVSFTNIGYESEKIQKERFNMKDEYSKILKEQIDEKKHREKESKRKIEEQE